jgi:hypothetical protein
VNQLQDENVDLPRLSTQQALDLGLYEDFAGTIDHLVKACSAPALEIRKAVCDLFTTTDLGIYWNPCVKQAGIYARPVFNEQEFETGINCLRTKIGEEHVLPRPLTANDLKDWWVKVAYSPTIRRLGEYLQFFPSKDIPGFGGRPIASTIASGLMGTGLGYGAGWLAERFLPEWAQEEGTLRKRLALLGGMGGTAMGATPGFINWGTGRSFNDPTLWSGHVEDRGFEPDATPFVSPQFKSAAESYVTKMAYVPHPTIDSTIGGPSFESMPLIKMDELGRVVWGSGASPQLAAMTMGAAYGANQMPDNKAYPGTITPHQTGLFGMMMGAAGGGIRGYLTGRAVGAGLGLLTGMPEETQNRLGQTGAAVGILGTLVPKLFN